jgi:phosphopantothenoylcysteine decarboxylase/phosphopantothenate--cysteine ligase
MERALRRQAGSADVVIMAAAVSDFRPVRSAPTKLRRRAHLTLRLEATPDIIARLPRREHQLVVGFALETAHVVSRAARKLRAKQLDLVLAQQVNGEGSPFGRRQVRAWLLARSGGVKALGRLSKPSVARVLLDKIETLWYGQREPEKAYDAARR